MSYKQNFNNTFRGNYYTLRGKNGPGSQSHQLPPQFTMSPAPSSDQEIVKQFSSKMQTLGRMHIPKQSLSISSISNQLYNISFTLNKIKHQEKVLSDNIAKLTEAEWEMAFLQIETQKDSISKALSTFGEINLKSFKKLVAQRTAKRLRLRRVRMEKRKEKGNRIKILQEKSRKIDENLQKIKDDLIRVKQEEETKLVADSVLKEVLRKKNDAKKCIVKVDALMKLRKARQNTATGKGEIINQKDVEDFGNNIEKLRTLWMLKLSLYEKEEVKLRSTLKDQCKITLTDSNKAEIQKILAKWTHFLFGENKMPQVDFGGDIHRFLSTRSQWDQYMNSNGTSLPVGWVAP